MADPIRAQSNEEELQRAREAEAILNNPLVVEALDAIERRYMEQWAGSDLEDVKSREFAFRMYRSAQLFRILLTKCVESGTLVAHQIADDERKARLLDDD